MVKPIDEQGRDAQHARHAQLAQFAPLVLGALDLKAARGYESLFDAIRYSNGHRERAVLVDAPLGVLPAVWRRWVVDDRGGVVRTRFELALWLQARDALRARGLYRAASHRYGDPASWMMPPAQWQRERTELAAVFSRPLCAAERLAQLETEQRRLARQLQDGYARGERVLYDGVRLIGEPPAERLIPESKLALLAPQMLPEVQYAQLLIDVSRDVPFLAALGHYGQARHHGRADLSRGVCVHMSRGHLSPLEHDLDTVIENRDLAILGKTELAGVGRSEVSKKNKSVAGHD